MFEVERVEQIGDSFRNIYRQLTWSHSLVGRTAQIMGWPERFPTDTPTADRAQFTQAYTAALTRFLNEKTELPQVKKFIEDRRATRNLMEEP